CRAIQVLHTSQRILPRDRWVQSAEIRPAHVRSCIIICERVRSQADCGGLRAAGRRARFQASVMHLENEARPALTNLAVLARVGLWESIVCGALICYIISKIDLHMSSHIKGRRLNRLPEAM